MSGAMPYLLDKGPYFEVIEDLLSTLAKRISILGSLRGGAAISDLVGFDSSSLVPDGRTPDERVEHLNEDWFGMTNNGTGGGWQKQPQVFPTGFWAGYQGDPEAILRDAMKRAIEVSLGLPPGLPGELDPPVSAIARQWPIDMCWICQGPWFQCWVLWRRCDSTAAGGSVTLLITTPAATGYPLTSKITRPIDPNDPPYTAPEYASPPPPDARLEHQGMWVVGHGDYAKTVICSTYPSRKRRIVVPRVEWRAVDPNIVVCVRPAEWEGGVLHDGRPYVP
jgi:hypothetical protein